MDPDHSTPRSGTGVAIGPLTVAEAAALLGVEQRTVIKYRQQGKIHDEKQGKAWQLWLSQVFIDTTRVERSTHHSGMDPERSVPRSGTAAEPLEAAYRVTPVEIDQAVARTGQQYTADLRTILGELREVYEGQLEAQRETIAELRRRAEAAERERDELRAQAAPAPPARRRPSW